MTGPWQVSGRSDLSTTESEALDMSYVWNWSVLGNMALPFGTVGAALGRKGAC
ncbi:sugar transferase [Bifidobacterium dentium]|nr:sugar transferase [Bifidobacterium dentium]